MSTCPRCSSVLREQTVGSLVVDGCDQCGGVWFDVNELGALALGGKQSVGWAEQLFEPPPSDHQVVVEEARCPKCGVPLYEFEFKHTSGVRLNACPRCKGIWVDDRELEAIAQRMPVRQAPRDTRHRARAAVGLMQRFPCPACEEANPASALVCWKCGAALRGRRGALMCPRCDNCLCEKPADLSNLDVGDARVDHCEDCGGVWVDVEALASLMTLPATWLEEWQAHLLAASRGRAPAHLEHLLCPVCQISLEERLFGEQSNVYVDRCTACRGTWLDRGELVLVKRVSIRQDVWRNAP